MRMISGPLCTDSGEAPAGTVSADRNFMRVDMQRRVIVPDELQGSTAVLKRRRIRIMVAGAIMNEYDGAGSLFGIAHDDVMEIRCVSETKTAAMKINEAR